MSRLQPTCPACGQVNNSLLIEQINALQQHQHLLGFSSQELEKSLSALGPNFEKMEMFRCNNCFLEYLYPMNGPSSDWYDLIYDHLPLFPSKRWEFYQVLDRLPSNSTLGEYGYGTGNFLELAKQRSINGHGIDFADSAVESGREKGLNIYKLDLRIPIEAQVSKLPKVSHVVAFHTLEHLSNPSIIFDCAKEWISANGLLWISVPSDRRPTRIFGERDLLDEPPHHLTRWTEKALLALAGRTGWQVRSLEYEPLSLKSRIWVLSIRTVFYRRLAPHCNKWAERLVRIVIAPFVLLSNLVKRPALSAHSMLICFELGSSKVN